MESRAVRTPVGEERRRRAGRPAAWTLGAIAVLGGAAMVPTTSARAAGPTATIASLRFAAQSHAEGDVGVAPVSIDVDLDDPAPAGGAAIRLFSSDGTAAAGTDYSAIDQELTVEPGGTTVTFVMNLLSDTVLEPDEVFHLTIESNTAGIGVGGATQDFTIVNDDAPPPPPPAGFRLLQEIEPASAADATEFFYAVNCSHGSSPLGGIVVGPVVGDGQSRTFTGFTTALRTGDVCTVEPSGRFFGDPLPAGFTPSPATQQTVTVGDPASTPVTVTWIAAAPAGFRLLQEIEPVSAADATEFFYAVSCSRGSSPIGGIVVGPLVGDGRSTTFTGFTTALQAGDVCTIEPSGRILGDPLPTGFSPSPSGQTTVTAGDPASTSVTFTWTSTGAPPPPPPPPPTGRTVTVGDVSGIEGDSGTRTFTFLLTLDGPAAGNESVVVNTTDGTASSSACDYERRKNVTVSFTAGVTTQTVKVKVLGDRRTEGDEQFFVDLSTPKHLTIGDSRGVGTILDDDPGAPPPSAVPVLSIDPASVIEGDHGTSDLVVTVRLDHPATGAVTVKFSTEDGTAKEGKDYREVSRTITIPAGRTSVTTTVPVKGDTKHESDETFRVRLSSPNRATLSSSRSRATATIVDDD